ncbi:alpha-hydroxy-acid oxidizing protein [Azospirillum sp. TSA2s]|uniref:alpha-hydroxy-acid oxidizing protein n=1 Tax=Azospirillum sp. TSA2s TaxID=709810 RepID=UPI0010AA4123|nr:alpha-hydroxy-acid oxidizing protein [Azospirillum sp. TSA2s]QCG94838.1 alpha-hydroxy-acid oxidizing protein [Azospirillum sp. TSA2s]
MTVLMSQFSGLAAGGEAGITHAIRILGRELDIPMALCGVSNVSAIGSDHLLAPV